MKKVVIVGGGPAGLFAAYKLAEQKKYEVTLIDSGKKIKDRHCPKKETGKCAHCKQCEITHGIGGAGCFSDVKLIYHTETGNNLNEVVGKERNQKLVNEVEGIFTDYGVHTPPFDIAEHEEMIAKALQFGIKYMPAKQVHVGSDKAPETLDRLVADLDIKIIVRDGVKKIDSNVVVAHKHALPYDYLILAPGRAGAKWLKKTVDANGIKYVFQPVDIGVRVEVPASIMSSFSSLNWDFKARMRSKSWDDVVRSFCVCPFGFVERVNEEEYCLVNGHSEQDHKSKNTNFAFLSTYKLKEPMRDGNEFGRMIAEAVTHAGDGKPILQRLGDLRNGHRRSTWERIIADPKIEPTLKDVTPGDIGSAIPYRFVVNIIEGLENLDNIIQGVADDSTLLYAPEIKMLGIRVLTDEYLRTNIPNISVAGDSPGFSRGIVGAAASGLLAAYGIIKENK
jgi:uncharacterized FAD-dependent dehydrogenase